MTSSSNQSVPNQSLPKQIHVTGICGVANSAIAIALHRRGVIVTGSDKGFYPPVSTYLTEAGIAYYAGWHPENIEAHGTPDFIMTGGSGTSPSNPELIYAREHGIPIHAFPEVLNKYFIRKNSIVIAGTWGKTTISALVSFVLIKAGFDPSYFSGGLSLSHPTGALTDSAWSVVEGDEYQIGISDKRPKFACYAPTHLLLTSVAWDHADLYPTEADYFNTFKKLVTDIPSSGLLVVCADDQGVKKVIVNCHAPIISYGKDPAASYHFGSVKQTKNGLSFEVIHGTNSYRLESPMLGTFNAENITAAFALAHAIGINPEIIVSAIKEFKGIKRRFEKRLESDVTVFDCHAPTPDKVASVLRELRQIYTGKIIAVFEPNIGGRSRETASKYDRAFKDSDVVIIPRLTKLKLAENDTTQSLEGDELTKIISKTQPNVKYIDDDAQLVVFATTQAHKEDIIVFLGSHGFRGMIEETVALGAKSPRK